MSRENHLSGLEDLSPKSNEVVKKIKNEMETYRPPYDVTHADIENYIHNHEFTMELMGEEAKKNREKIMEEISMDILGEIIKWCNQHFKAIRKV